MIGVLVGVVLALVAVQLVAWWQRRPRPKRGRVELCCGCNTSIADKQIHTVAEQSADDALLADGYGDVSTGVAADFCAGCCPGGCRRRHWPVVHRLRCWSARRRTDRQHARLVA